MSDVELKTEEAMVAYREKIIQRINGSGEYDMDYKKLIISLLQKINNERFLKAIYISVRDYLKESEGTG